MDLEKSELAEPETLEYCFSETKKSKKVKILRFLRNGLKTELESWEGPGMALGCLPEAKSAPKWPEKSGKFPLNFPPISLQGCP